MPAGPPPSDPPSWQYRPRGWIPLDGGRVVEHAEGLLDLQCRSAAAGTILWRRGTAVYPNIEAYNTLAVVDGDLLCYRQRLVAATSTPRLDGPLYFNSIGITGSAYEQAGSPPSVTADPVTWANWVVSTEVPIHFTTWSYWASADYEFVLLDIETGEDIAVYPCNGPLVSQTFPRAYYTMATHTDRTDWASDGDYRDFLSYDFTLSCQWGAEYGPIMAGSSVVGYGYAGSGGSAVEPIADPPGTPGAGFSYPSQLLGPFNCSGHVGGTVSPWIPDFDWSTWDSLSPRAAAGLPTSTGNSYGPYPDPFGPSNPDHFFNLGISNYSRNYAGLRATLHSEDVVVSYHAEQMDYRNDMVLVIPGTDATFDPLGLGDGKPAKPSTIVLVPQTSWDWATSLVGSSAPTASLTRQALALRLDGSDLKPVWTATLPTFGQRVKSSGGFLSNGIPTVLLQTEELADGTVTAYQIHPDEGRVINRVTTTPQPALPEGYTGQDATPTDGRRIGLGEKIWAQ